MIDVSHHVNAVERRLGTRVLEAGEARTSVVSRVFPGSLEEVWDAVTTAERIPRWFLPVTGDLRLGGRYQLEGNAGGEITACDPPTGFDATWEYGEMVSWIEVRLQPEGDDRTRLTLEHVAHVDDDMWSQYGPSATGMGWDSGLLGLALHLESGQDRLDAEAWVATDEGRRFMQLSGDAWCAADVAAGTESGVARERADRTIRAYTGVEET